MTQIPLVLATWNEGKTEENLADFGPTPPIDEDGETFEENAVKKARFTAKIFGLPALADDSGLMVEALGGLPGVRSARYAGEDATDSDNNAKLLQELENVRNRKAAFACVIAIAVPWGPALIYEGHCEGFISKEGTGSQGWGYDPLFFYPPLGKTFAQLSIEEKNRVSHRGQALRQLQLDFDKVLIWLKQRLIESGWEWLNE